MPCIPDQFPTRLRLSPRHGYPTLQILELPDSEVSACDTEVATGAGALSRDTTLAAKVDAWSRGPSTEAAGAGRYNCNARTEGSSARAGGGGTAAHAVCANTVYVAGIGAGAGEVCIISTIFFGMLTRAASPRACV